MPLTFSEKLANGAPATYLEITEAHFDFRSLEFVISYAKYTSKADKDAGFLPVQSGELVSVASNPTLVAQLIAVAEGKLLALPEFSGAVQG